MILGNSVPSILPTAVLSVRAFRWMFASQRTLPKRSGQVFEERNFIKACMHEVGRGQARILFIDDLHTLSEAVAGRRGRAISASKRASSRRFVARRDPASVNPAPPL